MRSNPTLRQVLQSAQRRWPIVVLCVLLTPAAAVALSLLQEKEYTASASLLFRDPQFDQKLFGSTFVQNSRDPNREAATNLTLVSLDTVAQRTAQRFEGMTVRQVRDAIDTKSEGQADVITVEATSRSPRRAALLANTFASEYIRFRRSADRAKIRQARAPLRAALDALPQSRRDGGPGRSLTQRLQQLDVLESLQTGNAELVQPAELPDEPSSPQPARNAALGVVLGLLLAAGLVALAEAFDRRLRDPAEIEELLRAPVLASLAETATLRDNDPTFSNVPEPQREAFRMLRVSLRYFTLSRDIRSVVITSADAGDGKTTVAWGLAVAAATAGSRTLLIEADLRRPSFTKRFGVRPRRGGLTAVLTGEAPRDEAIVPVALHDAGDELGRERSLYVLAAGALPPNPSDFVESEQLASLIAGAERDFDLVVVDTPPASTVSDAIPVLRFVGRAIIVCRRGRSSRDHVRRLRQQLDALGTAVLGVVVNSAERGAVYGGYGHYDTPAAPERVRAAPDASVSASNGQAGEPAVLRRST
jgi:capsular exopolysaccharide synthesis family protein